MGNHPKDKSPRRDRGQQALKEEARSLSHLMTHTPKNPYCDVCNKAKMYKPTSRSKGDLLLLSVVSLGNTSPVII